LRNGARVIDNQICYADKSSFGVIELFTCRYNLFKEYYNHGTVQAMELMFSDILKEARHVYDFEKIIFDPNLYCKLTDNIIYEIELSEDPRLEKSKKLLERVKKRDIYKYVGEKTLDNILIDLCKNVSEENIVKHAK